MSTFMTRRRLVAAAGVISCVMLVSACRSSGSGSKSSADSSTSATTAVASGGPSAPADASPIKIMQIGTFDSAALALTESKAGVDAHVKALNAAGGVDGHQLQITFCNDAYNANTGAACARQAVSDGDVAVVGPASAESPTVIPILAAAGIPWLAGEGAGGPIEATSTDSYPLHGGTQVMEVGMGRLLANKGDKNIVVIIADAAAAYPAGDAIAQGAKAGGAKTNRVLATIGAPDFSAVASSALAHKPNGIAVASTGTDAPRIIKALRQAGYSGDISSLSTIVSNSAIKDLGSGSKNLYLTSSLAPVSDTSIPQVAAFRAGMAKYDPSQELDNSSINGWTAVGFFAGIVDEMGTQAITAKSIVATLGNLTKPISLGTVPDYDGIPSPPPVSEFPRVPAFEVYVAEVVNGVVTAQGAPFNPLAS